MPTRRKPGLKPKLTAELLKGVLTYDKNTNQITNCRTGRPIVPGNITSGYLKYNISIQGYRYNVKLHRLIWLLANGDIPPGHDIDHINGNRLDNSLSNLRTCTRAQNRQNVILTKSTKYNLPQGVRPRKVATGTRYASHITLNSKQIHLGMFATPYEAGLAYIQAKLKHHTHADVSRLIAELAKWASQNK